MTDRKVPSRKPPAGTEARDEFNREVLGPEITNLMNAIWNYQPGTYPEELLRAAGAMLAAAPGLVALDAGDDVRQEVSKIIGGPISGETSMGDTAHAIRRWAATLTEDGKRIH